jgi:hypothetical protein
MAKINDKDFYTLANSVAAMLNNKNNRKKLSKKQFTELQKYQVNRMLELECIFKESVVQFKQSSTVYQKFILFIKKEKGNILRARPYFRQSAKVFNKEISHLFKKNNYESLKKYNINSKFLKFVVKNWKGKLPKVAQEAKNEHAKIRQELIENSLPLAINEGMKFYKAVPNTPHITILDLINASIAGLCIGIDKWEGPFRPVFRSVCLSRMKGLIMEIYNQTSIHYYPSDKKILYKIKLLKSRQKDIKQDELIEKVSEYMKQIKDTRQMDEKELENLLSASNVYSIEGDAFKEDGFNYYEAFVDENSFIEEKTEKADLLKQTLASCQKLSIIQKKILKLKGVNI